MSTGTYVLTAVITRNATNGIRECMWVRVRRIRIDEGGNCQQEARKNEILGKTTKECLRTTNSYYPKMGSRKNRQRGAKEYLRSASILGSKIHLMPA